MVMTNGDVLESVARNTRLLRLFHRLRQADLAQFAGLSLQTVVAVEKGMAWVKLETLVALSTGLGVETTRLFSAEGPVEFLLGACRQMYKDPDFDLDGHSKAVYEAHLVSNRLSRVRHAVRCIAHAAAAS
jgi:transcriptional regulator with XRE-family HTH domain